MRRISTFFSSNKCNLKSNRWANVSAHTEKGQPQFLETSPGFGRRGFSSTYRSEIRRNVMKFRSADRDFPPGAEDKWGWLMKRQRFVMQSGLFLLQSGAAVPKGLLIAIHMVLWATCFSRASDGGVRVLGCSAAASDNEFSLGYSPATVGGGEKINQLNLRFHLFKHRLCDTEHGCSHAAHLQIIWCKWCRVNGSQKRLWD